MTPHSAIYGTHVFFFPEGNAFTVPSAGTASRTSKPGASDPAWLSIGRVERFSAEHAREEVKIFAPAPGAKALVDVLETKRELNLTFTGQEVSPLALQLLYGTLPLTEASTQFNPLEAADTVRGWLKVQHYDQRNTLRVTYDVFVVLKLANALEMGDDAIKPEFNAMVLRTVDQTGTLA